MLNIFITLNFVEGIHMKTLIAWSSPSKTIMVTY